MSSVTGQLRSRIRAWFERLALAGPRGKMPALLPHAPAASLRVLAVVPGNGQGSSFIFARRQIASLANVDVNVRTFFLGSRTSPIAIARDWTRVRREIRQFHPHLIHAHYGTLTSFLCAVVTAIPLIITFRGNDLGDDPDVSLLRSRLGQLLSQASCLKAKQIICVSRRLRERLWWHRRRAVVIPSGVDMNVFCPQSSEQARTSLGWKKDERVVIFDEGRAPERKGLKFVQSAVRLAEAKVGPIRLAILDRSVAPDVVPCYLNASDCLALASVFEGSPNIVKEALACNLPVVSTDVGDVSERLSGVIPSKVVKRDPVEFANALAEVLLERRRSNGREMVEICSVPRVAAAIRSVYESSLAIPQEFSALDGVAQG